MCIETLDDLLSGKGPMTSVNVLHLLKRSYNLISDMLKSSRDREPLFFLKDIKTVVVDDFDKGSVKSSTKSYALAQHTRSHSAIHEHHAISMREEVKSTISTEQDFYHTGTPTKTKRPPKAPGVLLTSSAQKF